MTVFSRWYMLLLLIFLLAATLDPATRADSTVSVSPEFQSKIVELYSEHRCADILRETDSEKVRLLRPNVMAIVASCDPPWENPEKIFATAEKLSPSGDLILVLHAKFETPRNPKKAAALWNKVLLTARNRAFKEMAEDYFSGEKGLDRPLNLTPVTVFVNLMLGAGQESNPRPEDLAYLPTHGSAAIFSEGSFSWRHWYRWGSIAADYDLTYNNFFAESQYDFMDQGFDIPLALHLSSTKDIVFSPIGGFSTMGGSIYESRYGIAVSGVVYKSTYKQSVEGAVFQDNMYFDPISVESAAHYRFQYAWEFFPKLSYLSALLRIEHASAGTASEFNGYAGYFPFSHTDVGLELKGERTCRGLLFGLSSSFAYRFDSEESTFPLNTTGEIVVKRRVDKDIGVQPSVTIPLTSMMQLYAWYRYDQVISNIGTHDYVNRNMVDHTAGLALKASLSSY